MKKLMMLLLSLTMAFSTAAIITACGEEEPTDTPCTKHVDEDEDSVCDNCGETLAPVIKEVTVAFSVKDIVDDIMLPNVTVMFFVEDEETLTAVSGEDGTFSYTLEVGTYSVMYDYDVDALGGYFQSVTTEITVDETTSAIELQLQNTTPNGTESRPYPIDVGENEVVIPANTAYYYVVYRAVNLYAQIDGAAASVTYNGNAYTPDADGITSIRLQGTNMYAAEVLCIENTADSEQTFSVNIVSAPGSQENPYNLTLGEEITTRELAARESVYYSFTADSAGTLTITVTSSGSYVSMTNLSNSANANTNEVEDGVITLSVAAGQIIRIECSLTGNNAGSVVFTAAFNA